MANLKNIVNRAPTWNRNRAGRKLNRQIFSFFPSPFISKSARKSNDRRRMVRARVEFCLLDEGSGVKNVTEINFLRDSWRNGWKVWERRGIDRWIYLSRRGGWLIGKFQGPGRMLGRHEYFHKHVSASLQISNIDHGGEDIGTLCLRSSRSEDN